MIMVGNKEITGIVLSGGKSSRMGQDKGMLSYNGIKLIEYSISTLKNICTNVVISANNLEYNIFGLPVISDNYYGIGPIAGLEACLRKSETRMNIIAPCDSPLLNIHLYNNILNNVANFDAVVPVLKDGKIEPLSGFYSKEILSVIVNQIEKADYKIINLLKLINTKYIEIDNDLLISNINTPEDLKNINTYNLLTI